MTVIAWDGHTLAADRRVTSGVSVMAAVCKISRVERDGRVYLLGFAGARSHALDMAAWFAAGADRETFPKPIGDTGHMIVIDDAGGITEFDGGPTPIPVEPMARGYAIGSGQIEARVAMACGKSAQEAVEIASLFDTTCGNGVDTLTLESEAQP